MGRGLAGFVRRPALLRLAPGRRCTPVIASLNGATTGGWVRYAKPMEEAAANGLVLFNRFYRPDLDVQHLDVVSTLSLSTSADLLMRLHWTALLYGRVKADFAVTGGEGGGKSGGVRAGELHQGPQPLRTDVMGNG